MNKGKMKAWRKIGNIQASGRLMRSKSRLNRIARVKALIEIENMRIKQGQAAV